MANWQDDLIARRRRSCEKLEMINREKMFDPLLDVHPNFLKLWRDFAEEWADHPDGLPSYVYIVSAVEECSRMLADGQTTIVAKVLEVVESWLLEGDGFVREAATVGFLEDLQNSKLHHGTTPDEFIKFLGPESTNWWQKVERFWSHGELLVDDR